WHEQKAGDEKREHGVARRVHAARCRGVIRMIEILQVALNDQNRSERQHEEIRGRHQRESSAQRIGLHARIVIPSPTLQNLAAWLQVTVVTNSRRRFGPTISRTEFPAFSRSPAQEA